mmetsp:Transcript_72298/g.234777  ORF Transcript_72298/g.234777 Transcript_72298/m.234777 type:complete len:366 (+) Transcript_72298:549-1646(+)
MKFAERLRSASFFTACASHLATASRAASRTDLASSRLFATRSSNSSHAPEVVFSSVLAPFSRCRDCSSSALSKASWSSNCSFFERSLANSLCKLSTSFWATSNACFAWLNASSCWSARACTESKRSWNSCMRCVLCATLSLSRSSSASERSDPASKVETRCVCVMSSTSVWSCAAWRLLWATCRAFRHSRSGCNELASSAHCARVLSTSRHRRCSSSKPDLSFRKSFAWDSVRERSSANRRLASNNSAVTLALLCCSWRRMSCARPSSSQNSGPSFLLVVSSTPDWSGSAEIVAGIEAPGNKELVVGSSAWPLPGEPAACLATRNWTRGLACANARLASSGFDKDKMSPLRSFCGIPLGNLWSFK